MFITKWDRVCFFCGGKIKRQGRKVMRDIVTGRFLWSHKNCYYKNKKRINSKNMVFNNNGE